MKLSLPFLALLAGQISFANPIEIPAATAYLDPNPSGARVNEKSGITRWIDPKLKVQWFGQLKKAGPVTAKVTCQVAEGKELKLSLTVGNQSESVVIKGAGEKDVVADFGSFKISKPGYHSFTLSSPAPGGQIRSLQLDGPATEEAHFNLKPRRNSASVHLSYPIDKGEKVSAFYCEMTGVEEPLWTYYMACGWHRGYFGMQVNSPNERRIIFSVWDSGGEAIDRNKVEKQDRVTLISKSEGVNSGSFGNEGTGGHSHLKYLWKTGEKQRFLVTAEPVDETHTIFAGYFFHPGKKEWMLISSWKAPKEGKRLRGLYSFSENFAGKNGHLQRKALYGNQWIRTAAGEWKEITTASFSHDGTGKSDRLDRFMGVAQDGQFFLSQGGFIDGFTKFGTPFQRKPSRRSPADMKLPQLPPIVK